MNNVRSTDKYAGKAAHKSYERADADLRKGVLAQDKAARSYRPGQDDGQAEPSRRVEEENLRIGEQGAHHGARCGGVGAHLCQAVEQRADNLDCQRAHYDALEETGVQAVKDVQQERVAGDGEDVGHVAAFAAAELVACPAFA